MKLVLLLIPVNLPVNIITVNINSPKLNYRYKFGNPNEILHFLITNKELILISHIKGRKYANNW